MEIPIKVWASLAEVLARHYGDRAMSPETLAQHQLLLFALVDHYRSISRVDERPASPDEVQALAREAVEDLGSRTEDHPGACDCPTCDLLRRFDEALARFRCDRDSPARLVWRRRSHPAQEDTPCTPT